MTAYIMPYENQYHLYHNKDLLSSTRSAHKLYRPERLTHYRYGTMIPATSISEAVVEISTLQKALSFYSVIHLMDWERQITQI